MRKKTTGQAEAQPASPAAPGKVRQHFPALDRQRKARNKRNQPERLTCNTMT